MSIVQEMICTGSICGASFRDPSGFLFERDGRLYRQINQVYRDDYEKLMSSGLYRELVGAGRLVAHEPVDAAPADASRAYKVIEPRRLQFISYPYEWSFSALKDAALLTLAIQKLALKFGMSLKDCSAYNVQFEGPRPVFIDTLSFETYREDQPWVAYRQFCQHFLAPLALMSRRSIWLNQLLRANLDGVPLELARALLPWRTRLRLGMLIHLHLHAKIQSRGGHRAEKPTGRFNRRAMLGLIDSLESSVRSLHWRPRGTEWGEYYQDTNYSPAAMRHKKQLVGDWLDQLHPTSVWDLGANTGEFSQLAARRAATTVAFDIDPACVEKSYLAARDNGQAGVLSLQLDLTNPSPAIGWDNDERMTLAQRGPADLAMALALVHHLAIGANVPLDRIARFFARICQHLIVEFVPKSDSQVRRLLVVRKDVFDDYTPEGFERAFRPFFEIERAEPIAESERVLYLMHRGGSS